VTTDTITIPDSLNLSAAVDLAAADGKPASIELLCYGGGLMSPPGWGPTVIDLAGMRIPVAVSYLADHATDLAAVRDKRVNLNPQELGDPQVRAAQWQQRPHQNPVFDEAEVDRMAAAGVGRLAEMQVLDGGWGWFSGTGERSWPHTTAVVVHGLQIARESGVEFDTNVLERGIAWLKAYQDEQVKLLKAAEQLGERNETEPTRRTRHKRQASNIDAFVYMVLVDAGHTDDGMRDYLYRDRTKLSVYAMALFGLALHKEGDDERLATVLRNIEQYLVQDDENETAYLRLPNEGWWWRWYGHETEANAWYLKLLARTDPQGEKTRRLVKYLLNNRKNATYWSSTRDTAYAIEALAEYLEASGETQPDMTVEVWFDGEKRKEVRIDSANLFAFDNQWDVIGEAVEAGARQVELRRKGTGPLYYNAWLTNFTLEDFITRAGLEVKVDSRIYRLHRQDRMTQVAGSDGRPAAQRTERYVREELPNLSSVESGDLVEIELEIDSKNDYEYLVFEDMKAAGFEPVEVRSGYGGNALGAYMELRDDRVTFFVRSLARGKHSVSYRLRAEVPGRFSALPTVVSGMYAPELRGNSDEMKLSVVEGDEPDARVPSPE
jgi:alpha-2-macroglobulin